MLKSLPRFIRLEVFDAPLLTPFFTADSSILYSSNHSCNTSRSDLAVASRTAGYLALALCDGPSISMAMLSGSIVSFGLTQKLLADVPETDIPETLTSLLFSWTSISVQKLTCESSSLVGWLSGTCVRSKSLVAYVGRLTFPLCSMGICGLCFAFPFRRDYQGCIVILIQMLFHFKKQQLAAASRGFPIGRSGSQAILPQRISCRYAAEKQ